MNTVANDNPAALEAAVTAAETAAEQAAALPENFDYSPQSISKLAMQDKPDHPDLIGECRITLVNAGVSEASLALMDNHLLINQARGKTLLAQRVALNGFWHLQFAPLGTEAYGARQLLVNEGDDQTWVKWFSGLPLDIILKHNLPKVFGTESASAA